MNQKTEITSQLLPEILRDAHRYVPGLEQDLPTIIRRPLPSRVATRGREQARDIFERVASRAGLSRRHFDPEASAARLQRILELSDGLEATFALLGDNESRRAMLDVLKLRVLGPHHAPLRITPEAYRKKQAYADRDLRAKRATFEVPDPYFSQLSLYRVPVDGTSMVALHSHSVDVVSVFLFEQYSYRRAGHDVTAQPGDVVLDAGGCWGDTALYFANLVGPQGRVFTFEFDPRNLAIMQANLALNPELAARIEVVERALWNRSGETLEFAPAGRMTNIGTEDLAGGALQVETLAVDDFVEQRGLKRVDYIKMDVEGAELDVIAGARNTLAALAPKLGIAAYHRDDDLVRIPAAVGELNPAYRYYVDSFSPLEDETVLFADTP